MQFKRLFAALAALVLLVPTQAFARSAILDEPAAFSARSARAGGGGKSQFTASNHVLMLRADGRLLVWGDNRYGQLGLGDKAETKYTSPQECTFFQDKAPIKQILAIENASYVLLQNGEMYTCGQGANGRTAQGLLVDFKEWRLVSGSVDLGIFALYGNPNSASVYAITADDSLLAVGKNDQGQLGIGSTADALAFTKVMDNANIKSLHIGKDFAVIVHMDGVAKAAGKVGNAVAGVFPNSFVQAYSPQGKQCRDLGGYSGCSWQPYGVNRTLTMPSSLQCLFYANDVNSVKSALTPLIPTSVTSGCAATYQHAYSPATLRLPFADAGTTFIKTLYHDNIATALSLQYGNAHGIMQRADGTYIGWGDITKKQLLGQTTVTDGVVLTALNTKIADLKLQGYEDFAVTIAGDSNYLSAYSTITNNYKTWGWGSNTRGKLGVDSELASFAELTEITALDGIKVDQIVAGTGNVFFINSETGDVYSTGDNAYGQLGLGDDYTKLTANTPLALDIKYSETATPPTINSVTVQDSYAESATVTINATNGNIGIAKYTYSTTNAVPAIGWQASPTFTVQDNGIYFAWADDGMGNISYGFQFEVTKIDKTAPVIDSIDIPQPLNQFSNIFTVQAVDTESAIKEYALTKSNVAPVSGWQPDPEFDITQNGDYYFWAKDIVGHVSASYKLSVVEIPYSITVDPVDNGNVTVDKSIALSGETVTVTATPDTGYYLIEGSVKYNGTPVSGSSFTMPSAHVTVSAAFSPTIYNVELRQGNNGTITVDKSTAVIGDVVTVTVMPNAGYRLVKDSLQVDGSPISGNTFTMSAKSAVVEAAFEVMEIQGLVRGLSGDTLSDIEVALVGDSNQLTAKTNSKGSYSFSKIPDGEYKLVVSHYKWDYTEQEIMLHKGLLADSSAMNFSLTRDINLTALEQLIESLPATTADKDVITESKTDIHTAKAMYTDLPIKAQPQLDKQCKQKLESLLVLATKMEHVVNSNMSGVTVEGLEDVINPSDYISIDGVTTDTLTVNLLVENVYEPPALDKVALEEAKNTDKLIGGYMDVSLVTQLDSDNTVVVTEIAKPIAVKIPIPKDIANGQGYKVMRVHNGKVDYISTVLDNNSIMFTTDKFSTYAVEYTPKAAAKPDTGSGGSGSGNVTVRPDITINMPKQEGLTDNIANDVQQPNYSLPITNGGEPYQFIVNMPDAPDYSVLMIELVGLLKEQQKQADSSDKSIGNFISTFLVCVFAFMGIIVCMVVLLPWIKHTSQQKAAEVLAMRMLVLEDTVETPQPAPAPSVAIPPAPAQSAPVSVPNNPMPPITQVTTTFEEEDIAEEQVLPDDFCLPMMATEEDSEEAADTDNTPAAQGAADQGALNPSNLRDRMRSLLESEEQQ